MKQTYVKRKQNKRKRKTRKTRGGSGSPLSNTPPPPSQGWLSSLTSMFKSKNSTNAPTNNA